ncbi:hypothetical protein N0V85_009581, partial [Neurospora sp. IMI 360204]
HIYNNLVKPDGELRVINEIELTMVADHERPKYNDFIKVAYRWLVTVHCAGVAEHAMANIARFKPNLETQVVEGLGPHEREQCARRSNKRKTVNQAYPGLIKSEAEFWLRKGALHSTTIHETAESEADHHHTKAVRAISGAVLEELAWELYIMARDAQMGVTRVHPWSTSFTWRPYATFALRWANMVDLLERNNNSRAARSAANAQVAQQFQVIQGTAILPVAAVPVAAVPVTAVPATAVPATAGPATTNPAEGNNVASVGDADISPAVAQAAAAAVAPVEAPSDQTIDGNVPMTPPNSPMVVQGAHAPALAGPGNPDAYQDDFDLYMLQG